MTIYAKLFGDIEESTVETEQTQLIFEDCDVEEPTVVVKQ